jgi:Alpha-tubulin suppressor and related RCC1 domain-containing proteins
MEPNPRIQILEFLTDDTITQIKAKGNNNLAVTKNGKAYYWPMQGPSGEYIPQPVELSLPPKIQIATASCGFNFAVLVAKNGLVFSFGKDSAVGQLGHGDLQGREVPSLVEGLKHERVSSVSCGYKHVICRTTLGKVYTWGWGERGQLGHGVLKNQLVPKLVETLYPESKEKVLMIQAGYKHSIVLLETKKIMWWGSNSSINNQSLPIECDLYYKVKSYFYLIKVQDS